MENLIWLVALGALFYFMMRQGGCCGGHSHKNHNDGSKNSYLGKISPDDAKQPKCH
jgi:hypothetical protein